MLNVKAYIYSHLHNDAPLSALVPVGQLTQSFPDQVGIFPRVGFEETNQTAEVFGEDQPIAYETTITVHVFTQKGQQNQAAIVTAIDTVFLGLYFNIDYSADVPEPDVKALHRVMRYRRKLLAEELV